MSLHTSTKQKRTMMKAQRASDRSVQNATLAQQQTVVDDESHNFRFAEQSANGKNGTIFTVFHVKESQMDIQKRVIASKFPFLYNSANRVADGGIYQRVIPIPLRPQWNNRMTREVVQRNEDERFEKYLSIIYRAFPPSRLNHFEHNIDVWRQLWRVCELSDLLVLTVDARHPLFHFPPSLYQYIVNKQRKHLVVVFNKIDLVPASVLLRWRAYFEATYPGVVVLLFSSHPNAKTITFEEHDPRIRRKAAPGIGGKASTKRPPVGVAQLLHTWRVLAAATRDRLADRAAASTSSDPAAAAAAEETQLELTERVRASLAELDASDDVARLVASMALGDCDDEDDEDEDEDDQPTNAFSFLADDSDDEEERPARATAKSRRSKKAAADKEASSEPAERRPKFMVGLVGHPNAGKSSLINAVLARPAVSVSNTPGHTKHLQTIASVPGAEDVQLCDCPGLVFPAADMPRPLQVLMGIFPLATLREPYSCVQFLAERVPLVEIYGLQPITGADSDCALHGYMAPGGVSEVADEETFAAQSTVPAVEDESPFAYPDSALSALSRPQHLAHFRFGIVSSPVPVAVEKPKKGAARKSRRDNKRVDDAADIFNINDGRDELFADVDAALAAEGVRMDGHELHNATKGLDGSSGAAREAALRPRFVWSAWRICEALAAKKGWREDAGRPDTFRAGMQIIKDVIEGRICLYFVPPEVAE